MPKSKYFGVCGPRGKICGYYVGTYKIGEHTNFLKFVIDKEKK